MARTMILRTSADYRIMAWRNGRGQTTELLREDGLRLSIATVTEDGPFSVFPGIARNLTVISGPGFRLLGDGIDLAAAPLTPVAFPGAVAVRATEVTAPSEDFNVMTPAGEPHPEVWLATGPIPAGGRLFLLALGAAQINDTAVAQRDLLEMTKAATVSGGLVIAVRTAP
jgi:uncharacterized protein